MYRKLWIMVVAGLIVFSGCSLKGAKSFEKTSKRLMELNSYTCNVTMRIANNKSTMEYKLKHYYKKPDKYKIEVLEPKELEGQITVYNGKQAFIYHPKINQFLATENFTGSVQHNAFIGSFLHYLNSLEKLKVRNQNIDKKDYFVLEFDISGRNQYMCLQKIWIDTVAGVPVKSEIYDKDGNVTAELLYSDFVLNVKLQDKDFEAADIQ